VNLPCYPVVTAGNPCSRSHDFPLFCLCQCVCHANFHGGIVGITPGPCWWTTYKVYEKVQYSQTTICCQCLFITVCGNISALAENQYTVKEEISGCWLSWLLSERGAVYTEIRHLQRGGPSQYGICWNVQYLNVCCKLCRIRFPCNIYYVSKRVSDVLPYF